MQVQPARRRRAPVRSLVLAALVAAAALVPASAAHAATFVTVPPATNPSDSGPLTFSVKPDSPATAVAYELPGGQWQRCQGGTGGVTVQVGPLPDGDYQVLVADDNNASTVPIYSGQWYACQSHDPPGTAVSVYNFRVGSIAAAPAPVLSTPAPVVPAPVPGPTLHSPASPTTHASNAPLPLSTASARSAARAKAVRAWGARKPKVVSVHRVSVSTITCRVTWRTKGGVRRTATVKVRRTSKLGVRASLA